MQRINTLSTSTLIIATIISVIVILGFSTVMATQIEPMPIKVSYHDLSPKAKQQVECLAQNMYFESGHESEKGQIAVGMVTMNRVKSGVFPNTVCGVVKQKNLINGVHVCQFSWFCTAFRSNKQSESYQQAKDVAVYVYANYENLKDITKGALYYHADYVNPRWKLEKTTVIGRHIFYKESGKNDDVKNEYPTEGRTLKTFFLPSDGRDYASKY